MIRFLTFAAICGLLAAPSLGVVVVLKAGGSLSGINADLDSAFDAVTAADIVNVAVDDTAFHDNVADNGNRGSNTLFDTSVDEKLFKFDLASLPGFVGGTVHVAQLRVGQSAGNGGGTIAPIITHDWTEALARRSDPLGTSSKKWGPASNDLFKRAVDCGPSTSMLFDGFFTGPLGVYMGYFTGDVTTTLQGVADGTASNYGWCVYTGNNTIISSEHANQEYGPALFLSYTPAPEPATLVLLALGGLMSLRRRAA